MMGRAELVTAAGATIAKGSQSFAAASKLFAPATRERAWLLYAWCRAADDMTDGQELGHGAVGPDDPLGTQLELGALTAAALESEADVPLPFAALRQVVRETAMPRGFIADHLAGFGLDAEDWRPESEADLMRYCYHVAGTVGCMMAVVMGTDPAEHDTLDRACDLGLAFQLANIARDIVPDAAAGRCYIPADKLAAARLVPADLLSPANEPAFRPLYNRYLDLAESHLAAGWEYTNLISRRHISLRLACAWPILIGLETIQKLRDEPALDPECRVKVSREEVRSIIVRSILRYPFKKSWRALAGF